MHLMLPNLASTYVIGAYSLLTTALQVGSATNRIKNMGLGLRIWLEILHLPKDRGSFFLKPHFLEVSI